MNTYLIIRQMKNEQIILYVTFYLFLIVISILGVNSVLKDWVGYSLTTGLNSLYTFAFISVSYLIIALITRKASFIIKSFTFCALLILSILYNIYNYYGEHSLTREIQVFRSNLNRYNDINYSLIYTNNGEETLKTIALYKYKDQIPDRCFQIYFKDESKFSIEFYVLRVNNSWHSTDSALLVNFKKTS